MLIDYGASVRMLRSARQDFTIIKKRNNREIITSGSKSQRFYEKNTLKLSKAGLSIFKDVRECFIKYLTEKGCQIEKVEKVYPARMRNKQYFDTLPVGATLYEIDICHAYWRIAFLEEIITENLYKRGINNQTKNIKLIRNMALASVFGEKTVIHFKEGKFIGEYSEDCSLIKQLYANVRHICYNLTGYIADQLCENNYVMYNVDGIITTPDRYEKIKSFLDDNNFFVKFAECIKIDERHIKTNKDELIYI